MGRLLCFLLHCAAMLSRSGKKNRDWCQLSRSHARCVAPAQPGHTSWFGSVEGEQEAGPPAGPTGVPGPGSCALGMVWGKQTRGSLVGPGAPRNGGVSGEYIGNQRAGRQCAQGREQQPGPPAPRPSSLAQGHAQRSCLWLCARGLCGQGRACVPPSIPQSCWIPSAQEDPPLVGVLRPGPTFLPADTPLWDPCWACQSVWQWGPAAFGAMGTVLFSRAWTTWVTPLCPSHEPGLTGEAETGSRAS